jgi:3-oxo-5-alpha-steroid 4-dehydrogenase 3
MELLDALSQLPPSQWCQTFFLLSASLIVVIQALPNNVRSALMNYGARRPQDAGQTQTQPQRGTDAIWALLTRLTDFGQVPHSWFLHFYVISVSLSAVWAWQYVQEGTLMKSLVELQATKGGPSMDLGQVYVAWVLMALQGTRRLYESLYVSKPGKSPMWFVHWALGLVYYTTMSISVWIEGSGTLPARRESNFH